MISEHYYFNGRVHLRPSAATPQQNTKLFIVFFFFFKHEVVDLSCANRFQSYYYIMRILFRVLLFTRRRSRERDSSIFAPSYRFDWDYGNTIDKCNNIDKNRFEEWTMSKRNISGEKINNKVGRLEKKKKK